MYGLVKSRRKTMVALAACMALVAAAGCNSSSPAASAVASKPATMTNLSYRSDYNPGGLYAPIVYALAQGYYRDEGINLTVNYGTGSSVTADSVAAGHDDVGDVNTGTLAITIGKGQKLIGVGMLTGVTEYGLFVAKGGPIKTVADLKGKTILQTAGGAIAQLLPAVLSKAGLSSSDVTIVTVAGPAALASYENGQGDALAYGIPNAFSTVTAQKPSDVILFADAGISEPGYSFAMRPDFVDQNPDVVAGFLRATYKGIAAALTNEDAAVAAMQAANPTISAAIIKGQFDAYKPYFCSPKMSAGSQVIGLPNADDMSAGFAIMHQYQALPASVTPAQVVTDKFFSGSYNVSNTKCPITSP